MSVLAGRTDVILRVVSEHHDADSSLLFTTACDPVEGVVHSIHCTDAGEGQVDDVAVTKAVLAVDGSVALLKHVHDVGRCRLGAI